MKCLNDPKRSIQEHILPWKKRIFTHLTLDPPKHKDGNFPSVYPNWLIDMKGGCSNDQNKAWNPKLSSLHPTNDHWHAEFSCQVKPSSTTTTNILMQFQTRSSQGLHLRLFVFQHLIITVLFFSGIPRLLCSPPPGPVSPPPTTLPTGNQWLFVSVCCCFRRNYRWAGEQRQDGVPVYGYFFAYLGYLNACICIPVG